MRGAKEKTVAAQPVVLKALAKHGRHFAIQPGDVMSRRAEQNLESSFPGSATSTSHTNPMWRYYEFDDQGV
ncbi:MAG: hypothetical protein H6852_05325 [Geminicoccaceae bacterium]|nr:hypothetical protein [Geminicoccaceae bacterium]